MILVRIRGLISFQPLDLVVRPTLSAPSIVQQRLRAPSPPDRISGSTHPHRAIPCGISEVGGCHDDGRAQQRLLRGSRRCLLWERRASRRWWCGGTSRMTSAVVLSFPRTMTTQCCGTPPRGRHRRRAPSSMTVVCPSPRLAASCTCSRAP